METPEYYAGDNRSALMYENLPQAPRHRGGHRHPSTWKPPSGSSFIPSSLSTSALYPVHARIDSLSMSLVSIQNFISITYVIQFWITIRGCQTSDSEADLRLIKSTILVSI